VAQGFHKDCLKEAKSYKVQQPLHGFMDVLGEDRFGKGIKDAIGILRIISERNLDIDEILCAGFIDWQRHLTV
jgi:hypothetical protein